MIISRTPYRLSLFGGGTDYPAWFEKNHSRLITAAMNKFSYISLRETPAFVDYNYLINYSEIEKAKTIQNIKHPSARACIEKFGRNKNIQVLYDGDLPARSGIGSSSTFTVGLINALKAFNKEKVDKKTLATLAIDLEQNILNESVGIQDQIAASYGGIIDISMGPGTKWDAKNIILSKEYINELQNNILLGYSNVSRLSETHARKKVENINKGKSLNELREIASIANEAIDMFYKESDIQDLGYLLKKTWDLKKKLADDVTNDHMNDIYDTGIRNGAFGGKFMGAGGGGFFYFLAPKKQHKTIINNLNKIKCWVYPKFDFEGSKLFKIG